MAPSVPLDWRRGAGFTLIEMLASVFLTSIVLGLAVTFYVNLSASIDSATRKLRDQLQATALVDRLARDLEGAYLVVKDPETDPLEHPWIFLAESRISAAGADHVKFMTRNYRPRSSETHPSDIATVALMLRQADNGTYELLRWISPQLPEGLDREFPADDDNTMVLADGLDHFGLRFLTETGEWLTEWDSSTIEDSGQLPLAVEIEAHVAPELAPDEVVEAVDVPPELLASRRVLIPVRPVDVAALLESSLGNDEQPDCYTVFQCWNDHQAELSSSLEEIGADPIREYVNEHRNECVEDLEDADELEAICVPE